MYIENGIIRFAPQNENHEKLINHIKRQNGMNVQRRFNDFRLNEDGTVTIYLQNGFETTISSHRLSEVLNKGKVSSMNLKEGVYANISVGGGVQRKINLHRFIMRDELSRYEGFEEETGLHIVVNHVNGNRLDNTDGNLEVVTQSENLLKHALNHAAGIRKHREKFLVSVGGKYVGVFTDKEEARRIYKRTVIEELKRLEAIRKIWLKSKNR